MAKRYPIASVSGGFSYPAGKIINFRMNEQSAAAGYVQAGHIYYFNFQVNAKTTIDRFVWNRDTATAGTLSASIYDWSGSRVMDFGSDSDIALGQHIMSATPVEFAAGTTLTVAIYQSALFAKAFGTGSGYSGAALPRGYYSSAVHPDWLEPEGARAGAVSSFVRNINNPFSIAGTSLGATTDFVTPTYTNRSNRGIRFDLMVAD